MQQNVESRALLYRASMVAIGILLWVSSLFAVES